MPYPNEHAARQNNPNKYFKFKRENNALGRGIHVIWGIYVVNGKERVEIQSIRFSASLFSVNEAREWLKSHGYKTNIEPAR
jgi:hypothetical protein